jgi:hypothetical protein
VRSRNLSGSTDTFVLDCKEQPLRDAGSRGDVGGNAIERRRDDLWRDPAPTLKGWRTWPDRDTCDLKDADFCLHQSQEMLEEGPSASIKVQERDHLAGEQPVTLHADRSLVSPIATTADQAACVETPLLRAAAFGQHPADAASRQRPPHSGLDDA